MCKVHVCFFQNIYNMLSRVHVHPDISAIKSKHLEHIVVIIIIFKKQTPFPVAWVYCGFQEVFAF